MSNKIEELVIYLRKAKPDLYFLYNSPLLKNQLVLDAIEYVRSTRPLMLYDLDQTLIDRHAVSSNIRSFRLYDDDEDDECRHRMRRYMRLLTNKELEYVQLEDETFFKRPGVDAHLDWVWMNFHVGVITKATAPYAIFVIMNIVDTDERRKATSNDICILATRKDCKYVNETYNNEYNESDDTNDKLLSYYQSLAPDRKLIIIDNREEVGIGNEGSFIGVCDFDALDPDTSTNELERIQVLMIEFL